MSKAYPSNLTLAQYELMSDLIPDAKPGGRKREVDMWSVLNAIFYIMVEGVRWRLRSSAVPSCYRCREIFPLGRQSIHIAPSSIAKLDAIAKYVGKSRADILEEMIDKEFKALIVTADEKQLEKVGLIE